MSPDLHGRVYAPVNADIFHSVGQLLTNSGFVCYTCEERKRSICRQVEKRDTGVEPVSQPWEGWAQPIYQSRKTSLNLVSAPAECKRKLRDDLERSAMEIPEWRDR